MKNRILEFLEKHSVPRKKEEIEKSIFRRKNKYWLKYSQWVALKIISSLTDKNMSKNDLANELNINEEKVKELLSGSYNFTLKELVQIEKALNINLLANFNPN